MSSCGGIRSSQELGPRAVGRVESSRVELRRELGSGRVRSLGPAKSGAEPSQEPRGQRPGPGVFVLEIG